MDEDIPRAAEPSREGPRKVPIKVQVNDKRRVRSGDAQKKREAAEPEGSAAPGEPEVVQGEVVEAPTPEEAHADYLADLQRLQADFDNYRKRMMRQNAEESSRGIARLVEQLLPVLDNFELAISHGEGGAGVEMVFKELKDVLEAAGLKEVPGEGAPFDPQVHEAVDYREDDGVDQDTVRTVHRRGYWIKDKLLRAAMVGVVRPPEVSEDTTEEEAPLTAEG
ncbi:MAG: nucleotide exchange factor GrpE [Actinomycetota bacterium]|nr:nucleotide exchange factor GrpE [Actinomycetota bacterium]